MLSENLTTTFIFPPSFQYLPPNSEVDLAQTRIRPLSDSSPSFLPSASALIALDDDKTLREVGLCTGHGVFLQVKTETDEVK